MALVSSAVRGQVEVALAFKALIVSSAPLCDFTVAFLQAPVEFLTPSSAKEQFVYECFSALFVLADGLTLCFLQVSMMVYLVTTTTTLHYDFRTLKFRTLT